MRASILSLRLNYKAWIGKSLCATALERALDRPRRTGYGRIKRYDAETCLANRGDQSSQATEPLLESHHNSMRDEIYGTGQDAADHALRHLRVDPHSATAMA